MEEVKIPVSVEFVSGDMSELEALSAKVKAIQDKINKSITDAEKADTSRGKKVSSALATKLGQEEAQLQVIVKNIKELYKEIANPKIDAAAINKRIVSNNKEIEASERELIKLQKEEHALIQEKENAQRRYNRSLAEAEKYKGQFSPEATSANVSASYDKGEVERIKQAIELNREQQKYYQENITFLGEENAQQKAILGSESERVATEENIKANNEKILDGINKESEKIKDVEANIDKALSKQNEMTDAVKKTAGAMKETLTAEQKAAKESLASARSQASSNYYVLRSMKMMQNVVNAISNQVTAFEKNALKASANILKGIGKLAFGFKTFGRSVKSATKSHSGFVGSLKSGFMTILKYSLGIRSFYFLVNKLRKALVDAMGGLAQSSTHVNEQMSSLMSNISWMKNMLATVAQPILNVLVPALEYLANVFDKVTYAIASFFATLTGQSFVYKAAKATEDYAASLNKAGNSAKKASKKVREWDKLNIINSKDDSGSGGAFDAVEVETAASEVAKKVKDIFSTLFDPIKKAWDTTGKFVMDSWKYAIEEVGELIKTVGQDFLDVWSNDIGVKIWEDIFHIVGDVGLVIGNLAHNFTEAWKEGNKGKKILEDIQYLIYIIVEGIKDCADATVDWAKNLNFNPILEAIEKLLRNMREPVQTIVDIVSYFYTNVMLPFKKYIIEEGLPKMLNIISKIIKAIDWDLLESRMKALMDAFEPFLEKIWETMAIVLEDLGEALAKIVNSNAFGYLVDGLVNIMNKANPKKMAKIFEALVLVFLDLNGALKIWKTYYAYKVAKGTFFNITYQKKVLDAVQKLTNATGTTGKTGLTGAFSTLFSSISNSYTSATEIGGEFMSLSTKVKTLGSAIRTNLTSTLGPVRTALVGIVSAVAEFKLISSGVKGLITDVDNKGKNIVKTIAGVAAGLAGLTLMLGVPAGPLAAAIIGVIGILKGMNDAMEEINQTTFMDSLKTEVEGASYTFDDLADAVQNDCDKIVGNLDGLHEKFQTIDDNEETFENLKTGFDGVVAAMKYQSDITGKEINELISNVDDLKKAWDDYITSQYDAAIAAELANLAYLQTQDDYTEEVGKQILQRVAQLTDEKNTALEKADAVTQALRDELAAYDGTEESMDRIMAKYDEYQEATGGVATATSETADAINDATASLDGLEGKLSLATEGIENNQEYLEAWQGGISGVTDVLKGAYDTLNTAIEDNDAAIKNANDDTKASFEDLSKTLSGQMDNLDTETQRVADILQENIANQGTNVINGALEKWDSMEWSKKIPYLIAGKDKEQFAYEQFEMYANDVINGEDGLASQLESELSDLGIDMDKVDEYVWIDDYANNVKEKLWQEDLTHSATGTVIVGHSLASDWKTILDGVVEELEPHEVGKDMADGVFDGVFKAITDKENDYKTTFGLIEEYLRDETETHSPSVKFELAGEDMGQGILDGISAILKGAKDVFETMSSDMETTLDTLSTNASKIFTDLGNKLKTPLSNIFNSGKTYFNNMKTEVVNIVNLLKDNVNTHFTTLQNKVKSIVNTLKTTVVSTFRALQTTLNTITTTIKNNLISGFTAAKTSVVNIFTTMKTTVLSVFEAMKSGIKDIINGIIGLVEGLANKVIDGLNTVINSINDTLNFGFDNPFTKEHYEIGVRLNNLSNVSIPRLAQGAVIPPNKEFLAMLGDQSHGTNIEAPLDTIVEAFQKAGNPSSEEELRLLREQNNLLTQLLSKNLSISSRDIFNSVKNEARDYHNRTGNSAFVY